MTSLPHRKSPRLQGFDYSTQGAYFVTICTHQRLRLFGEITDGIISLSSAGEITITCWQSIPEHYPLVDLDAFVVMPNHVHGILCLHGDTGTFKPILGRVINAYKGAVTAQIRSNQSTDIVIWQSRYHDHILRNESDINRVRVYIANNPALWEKDTFYGERTPTIAG